MISKSEGHSKLRDACRDLQPLASHGSVYGFTASSLTNANFIWHSFIVGINTNMIEGAGCSGYFMKDGATMSMEYKVANNLNINSMYFTLLSDQVLNVRDSGIDVMEWINII